MNKIIKLNSKLDKIKLEFTDYVEKQVMNKFNIKIKSYLTNTQNTNEDFYKLDSLFIEGKYLFYGN